MRHNNISDIGACIHLIQFYVVLHSLSMISFYGHIQNILFIHVHNFEARDMKRCINSLSLLDSNQDLIFGITWKTRCARI